MRAVVVLVLLLPVVQAGQADYDTSSGVARYTWDDPVWFPGRDGSSVVAHPVHAGPQTFWIAQGQALAAGSWETTRQTEEQYVYDIDGGEVQMLRMDYAPPAPPCAAVVRPETARLEQSCTVDGIEVPTGAGVAQRPGPGVLHVAWNGDDHPVRLAYGGAWERLASSSGGIEPGLAQARPGPPWTSAAPGPWGPLEAGQREWGREDAYRHALRDPRLLELHQWLEGREVRPQAGSAHMVDDGVAAMETWEFTLTDGAEAFSFAVRRHAGALTETFVRAPPEALPLDAVPAQWPTVETLHARLRHHAGWDVEATWWGYAWDQEHGMVFEVAHDATRPHHAGWVRERAVLRVTSDGQALSFESTRAPDAPAAFSSARGYMPVTDDGLSDGARALGAGGLAVALWLLWPLFTRLRREHLLEHPHRRRIHEAVTAHPGIHASALGRLCALANGTLRHHLHVLERGGIVVAHRAGGHVSYTLAHAPAPWRRFMPLLTSQAAREVVKALDQPTTIAELERRTGVPAATIRWHLDRMRSHGLVERDRDGRGFAYRLAPDAARHVYAAVNTSTVTS